MTPERSATSPSENWAFPDSVRTWVEMDTPGLAGDELEAALRLRAHKDGDCPGEPDCEHCKTEREAWELNTAVATALKRFVTDAAAQGCHVHRPGGETCVQRQDSALAAQRGGPQTGRLTWGSEGSTAAFRDRIAGGEGLCRSCRATRALEGSYFPPGGKDWQA